MDFVDDFNPDILKDKLNVTKIDPDISYLSDNQKKIVKLLIKAGKLINEIFCLQKFPDNQKIKKELEKLGDKKLYQFFKIMSGPFNHFDNDAPYLKGVSKSIKGIFYPENLTKSEFNNFIKKNKDKFDDFISPYTIISRKKAETVDDELVAIPYSVFFIQHLQPIAELLIKASDLTDNYSLREYLKSQANAFLNNDYYDAEIRWVQLEDNDIEPLIGPFESYEDKFLGYKSAFTSFIGVKNKKEDSKLEAVKAYTEILQKSLPVPDHYKKTQRGSISQIQILTLVHCAGDGRGPIPTAAFNLPNSERIREKFGSKKILLHNIMENKFQHIVKTIAQRVVEKNLLQKITFNAYFNFILMHEISHELGVGLLKDKDNELREVVFFLKDLHTVIEETKADVLGIYSAIYLIKQSVITDCTIVEMLSTYCVSLLRSIRFGLENAHGQAATIQWNFLYSEKVIFLNEKERTISIDLHKFEKVIEKLLIIILTIQGEGDYSQAKALIKEYKKIDRNLKKILLKISDLPIDILPYYVHAGEKKPII